MLHILSDDCPTALQMLEDWIKNKNPIAVNQAPTLREKSILLVKLMQYVEKRFPDDLELNAQFLDIVNFIYRFDFRCTLCVILL
jgi:transformation/transcription domain-associated protein